MSSTLSRRGTRQDLDDDDLDLGSGGVMLLPDQPGAHPHLMITGGKAGYDLPYRSG